ncbi:MAG: PEP-CTERM sorting domain-containing protein [Anaerohalosphaeraceae bacterium]
MTRIQKTCLWLFLIGMLAASPAAQAALTYLPESSYYSGKTYYNVNLGNGQVLSGRIEFAVYDTSVYPGEFTGTAPGTGRYIYAYQIFHNSGGSNAALTAFVIKQIGDGAIPADNPNSYIGTDSSVSGVNATSAFFNVSRTEGNWLFEGPNILAGQNSVFLLVRSNSPIKVGTYDLFPPKDGEIPVPGEEDNGNPIPEPATLLLLGIGLAGSVIRKAR